MITEVKKMRKRIASLIVGGLLAAGSIMGLAACDNKGDSNKLLLWGPAEQQESLKQMVKEFLDENPDFGLKIELGVAGEGDAKGLMSNDVKSGADVFAYANDQLADLYTIGALARLGNSTVEDLKSTNSEDSVEAGKLGSGYYGYPYAADNGFFMYYDSKVVSEEQTHNLKDVLDACAAKGKYFLYQFGTGWYVGSFMYGAGGTYSVTYNDSGLVEDIVCDFDQKPEGSDYTYGELGGQALIDMSNHEAFVDGNDKVISQYLAGNRLGACISGTWNSGLIKGKLGDGYAATVLPQWTSSLDGKTYDWKSFAGYKLYGVNSFSKHILEAHKLAAFLSSEKMQEKRFDDNQIGPSNKVVAAMDKVQNNLAIATITRQISENSVIQTPMPDSYWSEMESFATALKEIKEDAIKNNTVALVSLERVQGLVKGLKAH